MEILFFDAIAAEPMGEAFAVGWIMADVYPGLSGEYILEYVQDADNFGIVVAENLLPEKKWVKDNIVPSWKGLKSFKNDKKMRQEFWSALERLQPNQIWTDGAFPVKSHLFWQTAQENFDPIKSVVQPFPIYDMINFLDTRIDRLAVLRELVTESSGNATGFIEIKNERLLIKATNPIITCMASMTLFSFLLDKQRVMLAI